MGEGKIEQGSLVVLLSGGPVMTVDEILTLTDVYASCVWFAGKKRESARFRLSSLKLATPEAK